MSNEYADILAERPKQSRESLSISELKRFCEGISQSSQPAGNCELERGYIVALGQEFRVTLLRADNGYKLVLLRAYIPLLDFPVMLDTYAEQMIECRDLAGLKRELAAFLRTQDIHDQIQEWLR